MPYIPRTEDQSSWFQVFTKYYQKVLSRRICEVVGEIVGQINVPSFREGRFMMVSMNVLKITDSKGR